MKGVSKLTLMVASFAVCSVAQTQNPVYFNTYNDAVTGDNAFISGGLRYWDVDAGSDSYQNDFYERPTVQTFGVHDSRYSANEYFEYLDITQAKLGWDSQFLYVSIDLFGRDKSTTDGTDSLVGLVERYGFRIGENADGRNSHLFVADQPELGNNPNTTFGLLKTFGYRDSDGDVGGRGLFNGGLTGLSVTKEDNSLEEAGMNGYNQNVISDGRLTNGASALFVRINPLDDTIVEFALDYLALGWTQSGLLATQYLEFEAIKGGPKDPANYLWNDKYNESEAGSPNYGGGGLSEFGTQGLGNIYELDTLRGGQVVPEPASLTVLGGALLLGLRRRKSTSK